MITSIKITDKCLEDYVFENNNSDISNLSRINIFIGPNNSGKSRFTRNLFSEHEFQFLISEVKLDVIIHSWNSFKDQIIQLFNNHRVTTTDFENEFLKKINLDPYLNSDTLNKITELRSVLKNLAAIPQTHISRYPYYTGNNPNWTSLTTEIHLRTREVSKHVDSQISPDYNENKYTRIYIPILRGLRPIGSNVDVYLTRTMTDYFGNKGVVPENIHTGLNYYANIKSKLLSTKDKRNNIKKFEDFIRKNFFPDKQEFTLIPKEDSDVLLIGFGDDDEDERHIYDLGDGIQAIIQLLYPIFSSIGEKALFFIEEPEINLHPGMQRVFLETLLSEEFKDMQFFMTTHSNHLLDLTLDDGNISVYGFSKNNSNKKFEIKNLVRDDKNILKDLGIRNSSIFLSNCTIWVEGITDRKYIKKYLELYWKENQPQKPNLEDLHYSFVEYAGSNIAHWDFNSDEESANIKALKLNQNIFLILDSDVDSKGQISKKERHEKLKVALKTNLYITEGKEIENSLSINVIKRVISEYEKIKVENLKFKKSFDSETIEEISHNSGEKIMKLSYWKENIGSFIEKNSEQSLKHKYINKYPNGKLGNTINDKDAFCDKAIKHLENYSDLSPEAIDLCKKLTDFIESYNKKTK